MPKQLDQPLAIDLYCGLGGWAEGLLAAGWRVLGFDVERHDYGTGGYPGELVLQDVLTLHGSQFRDAGLIVASPPCQAYSYRAMPWKRARALPPPDNSLFEACFRIQREASEAAGRHIPLVVENVCGAQRWVGRARWHYGSYYLWGDVPALMPGATRADKKTDCPPVPLGDLFARRGKPNACHITGTKVMGHVNKRDGYSHARHLTNQRESDAVKQHGKQNSTGGVKVTGDWFGSYAEQKANGTISPGRLYGKNSNSRKAASAMIAKIPFDLAYYIGRCYHPEAHHAKTA